MDSLTFLDKIDTLEAEPVYAVHGDEGFLKRQVIVALRRKFFGDDPEPFDYSSYPGDKAVWSSIHDELRTLPFVSPRRMVVIDAADPFVSQNRAALEKYVAAPAGRGTLVLEVKTWTATTKLAKALGQSCAITCKAPPTARLAEWCRQWCKVQHGKELPAAAAHLLVNLVGPEMGLLVQELAKLAVYAGEASKIESADVDRLVGNNREENTFQIFDLIGAGKPAQALAFLDQLLDQGEEPLKLLGMFGWQLRTLARGARLAMQGVPLREALSQAGFFRISEGEQFLRHLGRRRINQLFNWLLEVDLGIKGDSLLPPRVLLERLVIRLAAPATPSPSPARR